MGAAAFVHERPVDVFLIETPEIFAVAAPELPEDQLIRARAERLIRRASAAIIAEEVELVEICSEAPVRYASLFEAIQCAANGDERARKLITADVQTDTGERTIKAGNITEIELTTDEDGNIWQYGQEMDDVYVNALRYAADGWQMRERSEIEARNGTRIKHHNRSGRLNDDYFVAFSCVADNMTTKELQETGFFTDTMSVVIQVTHSNDGVLTTQSAFVAGVKHPEGPRHDIKAVVGVAERFGVDLSGKTSAQILDNPLLIPKELMPNGVLDLVRMYDEAAGGTFFGQDKSIEDYQEYAAFCKRREANFKPKVERIVNELIAEAPTITSPEMATERLGKISAKYMVEMAVQDKTINPDVFGGGAAARIEVARWHVAHGNYEQAAQLTKEAVRVERSSSCPNGKSGVRTEKSFDDVSESGESDTSEGDSGDCEFVSKECPECGAKDVKTVVKKISTTAKRISGSCGCSVTASNG
ncbi:MAG: hypothetical protein JWP13_660 [Candidatus Saccharibacteria bacterium]|nr:hypothetical protein [Candidatus Saccharibacteria bacterium]